jgi:Tol biopolymer transport system component
MKCKLKISLLLSAILICYSLSFSQYFGRNKVQYQSFNFKVLKTNRFNILYYPQEYEAVKYAGQMLERWCTREQRIFDQQLPKNQPVILYANHADFQQTNAISGLIDEGTGGVTEGFMNRVIIPLTGVFSENDHVLGHELTHAFQYAIMQSSEAGMAGSQQIPLWFIEGMAEYLSVGSNDPLTSMWMRDALLSNDLPDISQIGRDQKYFPYRYGQAVWSYIGCKWGDATVGPLLRAVLSQGFYRGFKDILGISVDSISVEWKKSIRDNFGPSLVNRQKPSETGRRLLDPGDINLSPSISPSGRLVAFISTRDLFSVDLYIADAKSGKVVSRIFSSESDRKFDEIRFINSTGTWSPDEKLFAFPVYEHGDNAIALLDIKSKVVKKTLMFKGVDYISQIAWAPDGENIAVSGTSGGISNLYLYNIKKNNYRQLTSDMFAELQPAWSPDGKTLAYITDKGLGSSIDSLKFAPMHITLMNMETHCVKDLSMAPWAKHINPQFSPDGKELYFISNPDGFSDIYKYSFEKETFSRITKIATGVSGLEELSPAMSVAQQTGTIVFNVFEKAKYKVNVLQPEQAKGEIFTPADTDYVRHIDLALKLPGGSIINSYLGNSQTGLISQEGFSVNRYSPNLHLLYVGQLSAGMSSNAFGMGVNGGISALWSDLLGNSMLGVGAQITGSIKDLGGETYYYNLAHRLNWAAGVSRYPYLSTDVVSGSDTMGGKTVQKITFIDERMYENQASFSTFYPISTNRRFEAGGGLSILSYDYQAEDIRALNGNIIDRRTYTMSAPSPLSLVQGTLAYVGDFSYFGYTSPVEGRRFRFELQPTMGSLFYISALADFRQYFLISPLTVAFHFMQYGRYFRDSESDRLSSIFIGDENWVRGYSYYSFDLSQCTTEDFSKCPEFDRLLGSRIGVFNAELRLPLFGGDQFGLINFPYLPTELVGFFDGGVAWNRTDTPKPEIVRKTLDRVPVFSAGAAARFNVFGILVLQIYYAYPFQRTDKSWQWGFLFAPGW